MDNQAPQSTALGGTILEWLSNEALQDSEPGALYGELCQRLRGVGMPILRGQVAFRILHPLYDASAVNWDAERGAVVELYRPGDSTGYERFVRSPLGHALAHRLPILRRRLTGETALLDFESLEEMRSSGGTDYVVFVVGFGQASQNGILCSWLGDRPAGFTDGEIAELQRVTRELAALGLTGSEVGAAVEEVLSAIAATLADSRGRWLFDPGHADACSEYALTGVHDKKFVHLVLDRTFVDREGIRWIVDFKLSRHESADRAAFLEREQERYRTQLETYAQVMREVDPRPIRVGLYFPLVPGWREWTPAL